jgi:hypothetical protein
MHSGSGIRGFFKLACSGIKDECAEQYVELVGKIHFHIISFSGNFC